MTDNCLRFLSATPPLSPLVARLPHNQTPQYLWVTRMEVASAVYPLLRIHDAAEQESRHD